MNKQKCADVINILAATYPNADTELNFTTNYELLVAVMLSAQCTDKRVNLVTAELFKEYNTPEKMLTLSSGELEQKIKSCGLYRSKAAHILSASKDILDRFNGQIPSTVKDLQTLAGVGRKTANVVFAVGFGGDAIAVDTHVFRVSNRIGLANAKNPLETEKALNRLIDQHLWGKAHHYLIHHGRNLCSARSPKCDICPLADICKYNKARQKLKR